MPVKVNQSQWRDLIANLESSAAEFDAGGYPIGGSYWLDGQQIGSWGPWAEENWVVIYGIRYELD